MIRSPDPLFPGWIPGLLALPFRIYSRFHGIHCNSGRSASMYYPVNPIAYPYPHSSTPNLKDLADSTPGLDFAILHSADRSENLLVSTWLTASLTKAEELKANG